MQYNTERLSMEVIIVCVNTMIRFTANPATVTGVILKRRKMVSRLVDADALKPISASFDGKIIFIVTLNEIRNAPTIDAVPVVRCKDCVCAEKFPHEENVFKCTHPQWDKSEYGVYEDDYCSYGERRKDDEEYKVSV